ncbi:ArnT family glycosyltransferase [Robiginitalea marina]|uniref:Glycosyltransferase family 39 protein n=1 Tax=Robiginitalea marina TaxID=2954105 RepID=A0ABT1AXY1_9FLAO|nr:glycosyltransferase family 39 protein [Robiginitalea marina]MCO5724559.1 glycosyltransferase family 39 protein [Robiginitalea marina]
MKTSFPRPLILLLGALFLVNLAQAFFTELLYDEAYYWYYAQSPDWGYFDHPPMVAWMIGPGLSLFNNELGVRLVGCLMGIGTLLLIWAMTNRAEKTGFWKEFLVWTGSIPLMHAYGFLSLPDTPLLFFTALFLLLYRNFLQRPGYAIAIALGVVMASLMYSKYHAALVILFVLLSNLSLLKNRFAWVALAVSLLCYAPHLVWLYEYDFISIRFHLFERPNQPYRFTKFTLGFLLNLLALFGLTFPWVSRTVFRFRPGDRFERALWFVALGVLLFFFLSSFQRRVQTQWLIVICIPVAVLVFQKLIDDPGTRKWLWRAGLANLVILFGLRVGLMYEPLFPVRFETHGNKRWTANLAAVAGDAPVVFENSYRNASMYSFYSGKPAISLNNAYYRKNQYSIDDSESRVQGKQIFYVPRTRKQTPFHYLDAEGEKRYGFFISPFASLRKLEAGFASPLPLEAGKDYTFWVHNPYDRDVDLTGLRFGVGYLDAYKRLNEIRPLQEKAPAETGLVHPGDTLFLNIHLPPPGGEAPVFARAVISEYGLPWGLNGSAQPMKP